jgi:5-methylthioadenosine/S-adenosylhomocysteine deaminase
MMHAAALMNQLEMIRGGTTTFLDIYRFPSACAQVVERSGLRAVLAPQVILDPSGPGETVESAEEFVATWKDRSPRVIPAFGPHALYSCAPPAFQRLADLAEQYDVPLHTHLAETQWEVDILRERYGAASPTRLLETLGVLGPRLSVAHGVHLSPEDMELLAERQVSVIYNPSSNMKLASGVAPVPELLRRGVRVGLGTDSNLSNNNLDMFEEMRLGAVLQKLQTRDPAALPCDLVLELATIGAARALGLADRVGSLEAGKQADVILVDLRQPHLWPLLEGDHENIVEQLVYSANAGDVTHTLVDGALLMRDRQVLTLDAAEVRREVEAAMGSLLVAAGIAGTWVARQEVWSL